MAKILRGMIEGGELSDSDDIYAATYEASDGDIYVSRAAGLLEALHARVQELEASQARVPLSDEQILAAFRSSQKISTDHAGWVREQRIAYGRALEAAHGITQEKQG